MNFDKPEVPDLARESDEVDYKVTITYAAGNDQPWYVGPDQLENLVAAFSRDMASLKGEGAKRIVVEVNEPQSP